MAPRPFPNPISIGTDIAHIPRFSKYLGGGQRFLFRWFDKVLLPGEQRAFWRRFGSLQGILKAENFEQSSPAARWMAGRWAAKEAIIKAYASERSLLLRRIEIRTHPTGQPFGIVHDEPLRPSNQQMSSASTVYTSCKRQRRAAHKLATAGEEVEYANEVTYKAQKADATPQIMSKDGVVNLTAVEEALRKPSSPVVPDISEEPAKGEAGTHKTPNESQFGPRKAHVAQGSSQALSQNTSGRTVDEWEEDDLEKISGQIVRLSISHDGDYCIAVAMAPVGA